MSKYKQHKTEENLLLGLPIFIWGKLLNDNEFTSLATQKPSKATWNKAMEIIKDFRKRGLHLPNSQ